MGLDTLVSAGFFSVVCLMCCRTFNLVSIREFFNTDAEDLGPDLQKILQQT